MSVWSYEYGIYEIGVEACVVGLWILMLGVRHSMYVMDWLGRHNHCAKRPLGKSSRSDLRGY